MQNFRVKTTLTSVAIACLSAFGISMTAQATTLATVGINFTGTSRTESGLFYPPDTMGAVGLDHIVQLLNGSYAVYDKSGSVLSRISLNQFWQNAGVTRAGDFAFDPRVNYDPFSGRWFAASVDNALGVNNFLVAVSQTSNPLDGWNGYAIPSDTPANTRWADFDTLGFNGQSVTIAANMFPISSGSVTTTILTFDKAQLIAGNPNARTIFQNNDPNDTGFSVQPVVDLDNRNNPHPLLSDYNTPAGFFKRSDITGNPASATLSTTGGFISATAYDNPPTARQPGGPDNIDAGDTRFSSNVVYQLDSLGFNSFWGVQTVKSPVSGASSALRWFEIDANTNLLRQQGLIYDPTGQEDYYYGSLAVNDQREVVIGFSCSGPNLFISSCAVVGEDSGGTTTFGNRLLLKQGSASYEILGGGYNRWGDYSATVLDPSDPTGRTFWTFQEFAAGSTQWSTQITEIKLSKVNVPEPTSTLGLLALGTLGAASTLKRKLKSSQSTEKETTTVG
ncbi:MAG: PEP-CTERM sorting domain-containing protein [Merismopediaceae bacterium]|nr:PEP-CTERM sorting domain-containing protein [Merismopediaceae bacterium]